MLPINTYLPTYLPACLPIYLLPLLLLLLLLLNMMAGIQGWRSLGISAGGRPHSTVAPLESQ